jgi:hypothetical protein
MEHRDGRHSLPLLLKANLDTVIVAARKPASVQEWSGIMSEMAPLSSAPNC